MVRRVPAGIGIKMLFEALRRSYAMTTADDAADFKLNNNGAPFYARLLCINEPELVGAFETRTQTWQLPVN